MKRKGWKPNEDDMNLVVAIHNAVNEQAWVEVVKMEKSVYPECDPKLLTIQGKESLLKAMERMKKKFE
jgi:cytochrome c heme-lyase